MENQNNNTENQKQLAKSVVKVVNMEKRMKKKMDECLAKAKHFELIGDEKSLIAVSHEAMAINLSITLMIAASRVVMNNYAKEININPNFN